MENDFLLLVLNWSTFYNDNGVFPVLIFTFNDCNVLLLFSTTANFITVLTVRFVLPWWVTDTLSGWLWLKLYQCLLDKQADDPRIVLPPEIFQTVPGTARVQFVYFPNSRLFRGEEDEWHDTGPVIGASLRHTPISDLSNCVTYEIPNTMVSTTARNCYYFLSLKTDSKIASKFTKNVFWMVCKIVWSLTFLEPGVLHIFLADIVTTRVWITRESTVFTGVCSSTLAGRGGKSTHPRSGWGAVYPFPRSRQGIPPPI